MSENINKYIEAAVQIAPLSRVADSVYEAKRAYEEAVIGKYFAQRDEDEQIESARLQHEARQAQIEELGALVREIPGLIVKGKLIYEISAFAAKFETEPDNGSVYFPPLELLATTDDKKPLVALAVDQITRLEQVIESLDQYRAIKFDFDDIPTPGELIEKVLEADNVKLGTSNPYPKTELARDLIAYAICHDIEPDIEPVNAGLTQQRKLAAAIVRRINRGMSLIHIDDVHTFPEKDEHLELHENLVDNRRTDLIVGAPRLESLKERIELALRRPAEMFDVTEFEELQTNTTEEVSQYREAIEHEAERILRVAEFAARMYCSRYCELFMKAVKAKDLS